MTVDLRRMVSMDMRSEQIQVMFWRWSHEDWLMDRNEGKRGIRDKYIWMYVWTYPNFVSILLLMGISVVYTIELLWVIPLWTFLYMSFNVNIYASLLDTYQKEELLSHRVNICSVLVDNAKQFSKVFILIYFPTSNIWAFQIIYIFVNTWYFLLFVCFAILKTLLW